MSGICVIGNGDIFLSCCFKTFCYFVYILGRRKIFRHCAAKIPYRLANPLAHIEVKLICSELSLRSFTTQFVFGLRCAK